MNDDRQQLELEISRCNQTAQMLNFMARAVEEGPSTPRQQLHQADAIEALLHGAEVTQLHGDNLRHCAEIHDHLKSEASE